MTLYLLGGDLPWWDDLLGIVDPSADASTATEASRARLFRILVDRGHADLWTALADALLFGDAPAWERAGAAPGVVRALRRDVEVARAALRCADPPVPVDPAPAALDPALRELAPDPGPAVAALAERLRRGIDAAEAVDEAMRHRAERGGGSMGRYRAFRWDGAELRGIEEPTSADSTRLRGLDRPLARLEANTLAFLAGEPAMHVLVYGPRGSGKSTAIHGLLARHAARGLRLVEVPADALGDLPAVLARLARRPERFVLFVDDLAFEAGDVRYQPLKTLLEGSVAARPANVRLYATSNRRHLVHERLRDRPDPLDDDVHAWDTQHERLALADRFGMLLTFPSSDKRRYLEIVRHLAARDGVHDPDLEGRADRFAREGNGYSGRTAQQFVDAARAGLA